MRANVCILRLAIIAILAVPGPIWAQVAGEGSVSLPFGTVAPGAALQDLEGNSVDLIDTSKEHRLSSNSGRVGASSARCSSHNLIVSRQSMANR